MSLFTISWKPLDGSPSYLDRQTNSNILDVSRGITPACEFPLPAASGYGICQVFCKNCRHSNNITMTGRAGDYSIYKVDCRKVKTVTVVEKRQLELAV